MPSLCALEAEDGPQASLWKAAGSARRARRSANLTTWSMELVPSGTTTWLLGSRAFAGGDGSWDGPNTGAALVLHRPRACWAMQSTTADFASHRPPSPVVGAGTQHARVPRGGVRVGGPHVRTIGPEACADDFPPDFPAHQCLSDSPMVPYKILQRVQAYDVTHVNNLLLI